MTVHSENTIGWREWLALPDLNLPAIKAKIDTGAKTSALHAVDIQEFTRSHRPHVRFTVQPLHRKPDIRIRCEAEIFDRRRIKDSGGRSEERYIILTTVEAGTHRWKIQMSLSDRSNMMFPMLLGRDAVIDAGYQVDSRRSYSLGRRSAEVYLQAE